MNGPFSLGAMVMMWGLVATCDPQKLAPAIRTWSRRSWRETVLVMKTAQNGSRRYTLPVREPMAGQQRRKVARLRNASS